MFIYQSLFVYIYLLSGYLLTPDPDQRPDIYQASYLAFKLNDPSVKCPVQNLNKVKKPSFDDISLENPKAFEYQANKDVIAPAMTTTPESISKKGQLQLFVYTFSAVCL